MGTESPVGGWRSPEPGRLGGASREAVPVCAHRLTGGGGGDAWEGCPEPAKEGGLRG